jgi:hypothetical protein
LTDDTPEPRLPGRTTPTWDMELLVSAASVFTLVQLPGWLDEFYFAARPRLDANWDVLARILYTYAKLGLLALAAAFALHLAMRAYWIALVGMDSIYPGGVLWDRLRTGPRRRALSQARAEPMPARIERIDNRASIVFALGITFAILMLVVLGVVALAYVVALALDAAFGWHWLLPDGFLVMLVAASLPYAIAFVVDRRLGDRLAPGGRVARAIDAVYAAYARVGYGAGGNPTLALLQSHVGERRISAITLAAMGVLMLVAVAQASMQQGAPAVGDYARWPTAAPGLGDSLVAAHYRDQGAPEDPQLPSIDSAFPRGDYLTVVVPFDPRRHPAQVAQACPQAWNEPDSPARRVALRDCFARWLDLRVDGQPVPAPAPRYYTDPRTGQEAIAAIVPIRGLAPGEHELRLALAPSTKRDAPAEPVAYRIAFWR